MHPLDLGVLVVYLAGIVAFGAYFSKSHHTIQDYFVSGKTIPWWAIMGSIVATETSTVTFAPSVDRPARLDPRMTFDSFVPGSSNRLAFAAAQSVAETPGRA